MNSEETYISLDKSFFFDSYALFEIIKENPSYKPYIFAGISTTKLNIFELFHGFLKDNNLDLANKSLEGYYPFVVDFDEEVIKAAAIMKKEFNKRDLSMDDCIGYCLAKQIGVKFLTGDEQFRDLDNVEFVK